MATELIINATLPETRIALLENNEIQELHIERDSERGIVGNIYKGKVIRVLPGMQACFVDIGLEKAAFLYVDDIFFPDMKNPLATNPLPEPVAKPAQPQPGPGAPAGGRDRGRGRGQRLPRGAAPGAEKPASAYPPGSPEEHAALQREYALQMLEGAEGAAPVEGEAAQAAPSETQPPQAEPHAPIAAAPSPAESAGPTGQPEARSPQGEPEEEDEEPESPAVYRPEPLIDTEAWAEELKEQEAAPASEAASTEAAPEQAAAETEEQPAAAAAPAAEEQQEAPVAEAAATAAAAEPVAKKPLVEPLATPIPVKPVGVEDDDDEEDEESEMPRRRRRREPVNISDLVREGQEILVQVAKDPIGTKGARLTCHVSLPGRYLVFMPTVDHIGVSRRIESEGERRRLKETMGKIRPSKTGVIVRTASGKQTDKKLKQDLDYLVTTWNDIQKKYNKQRTASVVYQDLTIVLRAIRDMFTDEVDKVVVDSRREHKAIMRFVTRFIPQVKDKVELYEGDMPIFDTYGIETEISRALERKVWLKSGGYLVVDQTEALVAIDVNTGRYVGKKTLEETILKTNLEAVKEIAYQLRLRNCGGIIILDLIDMEKEANKDKVYKALEEALKKDRARPSILKISQLGLIEMTRKRTRDSMVRSLCESCTYCEGKGFVKNKLTIAYDIMRDVERELVVRDTKAISIQCHPTVADVLLEDKRDVLEDMEQQWQKKITIRGNGAYHVEQYELVAHREAKNVVWSSEERRQMLRQKIQERQQQLASEQRKQAEVERQERRRQDEERRKEQDRLRAERRAQAEERRRQVAAERAAARAAAIAAQGLDPNAPLPPELEAQFAVPEEADLEPELDEELESSGQGAPSGEGREGGEDRDRGRRRRRRGRRGRGRNREEGTGRQGAAQSRGGREGRRAQGGRGPHPHPRPQAPAESQAGGGGGADVGPGGEAFTAPAPENLGAADLAGSASSGGGFDGTGGDEGQSQNRGPREAQGGEQLGPDGQRRRRRRGRRGGRRRRRGGGTGPNQNMGSGAPGGSGEGGGGGGEHRSAPAVHAAPRSGGGGGEGHSGD